ncbi:15.4 kDa class V heat shock protein [Platanthera zijinensis]|uniref:15.4 kDa class V heat shock protein n=1 Tax=Platanthera zijinensis TaxID=2320716 RepID=A0AAP0AXM5_9ASPA
MELYAIHRPPWPPFIHPRFLLHPQSLPDNYVHWTQTPDSHLFSADLPGIRKEEIRVELEDSRYLLIRTERTAGDGEADGRPTKEFMRKFRLPTMVEIEGISAAYEDGVLTIRVPRMIAEAATAGGRSRLHIELTDGETHAIARDGAAPAA